VANGGPAHRDRYFDGLRAIAIARVVAYHMFPLTALELAFPSIGVMFALGGSLMARSIDRSATAAVTSRVRRLLPALWLMGAVLVPAMIWIGWSPHPAWPRLLLWIVPLADPPASAWGQPAAGVLWYLVTYLWLVLLSPAMLRLYRRWPLPTVLLPLAALAALMAAPGSLDGTAVGSVLTNVLTFAACWILGFAHRDGGLRRMALRRLVPVAGASVAIPLGWAWTHPGDHGFDLVGIPLAYAVYSVGFVLVLLRLAPRMDWLVRVPLLNGLVTLVNARAVTIYLWHNVAITASIVIGDRMRVWRMGGAAPVGYVAIALVLLAVIVLGAGWVEDLAARRPARLLPRSGPADGPRPHAADDAGGVGDHDHVVTHPGELLGPDVAGVAAAEVQAVPQEHRAQSVHDRADPTGPERVAEPATLGLADVRVVAESPSDRPL
jgi:peptidoglycan/LPS O-acetylase OafA/YrhL